MLDFTSSLYLGLSHEVWSLRPWSQLTTGRPAALLPPIGAHAVAGHLARLQGCERATLASSTLHLFWDLFGMLARARATIFLDAGAYPVARWGVERAAAMGVPVQRIRHNDVSAMERAIAASAPVGRRPIIVTDGVCACCGCGAPLRAYHDIVHARGGWLVIDDSQAYGLFGHSPGPEAPYGRGGGGSLRRSGVRCGDVIAVSSLAKSFGVPMAMLASSAELVQWFEAHSETRSYCSPPSAAAIHAAQRALSINARQGEYLRDQLAQRVRHFRRLLAGVGLKAEGALFPMQTIASVPGTDVRDIHRRLWNRGVRALLRLGSDGREPHLSLILTARHGADEVERAVEALTSAVADQGEPAGLQTAHG